MNNCCPDAPGFRVASGSSLEAAEAVTPDGFANRSAANWHLLLAIVETAGDEWSDKALKAAEGVYLPGSIGWEPLAALKVVFDQSAAECMSSYAGPTAPLVHRVREAKADLVAVLATRPDGLQLLPLEDNSRSAMTAAGEPWASKG
jgi:hypothetical protein